MDVQGSYRLRATFCEEQGALETSTRSLCGDIRGALTTILRFSKEARQLARIGALAPGWLGIWSRWEPALHCDTTPTSVFDHCRLGLPALPGHAHAHGRRNPVSDHQPAGVSPNPRHLVGGRGG